MSKFNGRDLINAMPGRVEWEFLREAAKISNITDEKMHQALELAAENTFPLVVNDNELQWDLMTDCALEYLDEWNT